MRVTIDLPDCCGRELPRPGKPRTLQKREFNMASFGIVFGLPPVTASDVAKRELTVTVNGAEPPLVRTYDGQPLKSDEFVFADADAVSVTLVDVDGHGNRSPASAALSFVVVDDVPPAQPGDLSVATKRQID